MTSSPDTTARFTELLRQYNALIFKVCYMYAEDNEHLRDLYQEVATNIWSGMVGFSGKSKISTCIYRIALNTCITYFRRHGKHSNTERLDDRAYAVESTDDDRQAKLKLMYELIGGLGRVDKAIIMLWLDEHSYDKIAAIVGMTRANVASRIHRIKKQLSAQANS